MPLVPGRERHSLHLHASTKAGVDEILRPCLSASASQKRQFTEAEARVRRSSLPTWCTRPGPAAGTRRHSRRSSASWTPCVTRRRGEGEEASYRNPELCDRYKRLPLATIQHGDLTQLPGSGRRWWWWAGRQRACPGLAPLLPPPPGI